MPRVLALSVALLPLLGCFWDDPKTTRAIGAAPSDGADAAADEGAYEALRLKLEEDRVAFLGRGATDLTAAGQRLFWVESQGAPSLHSVDAPSGARVDYTFPIGGASPIFRASGSRVVTVTTGGDRYRAYRADAAASLVGELTVQPPPSGVRWHAFAVDGDRVYVAETTSQGTRLLRWTPPSAAPVELLTFQAAGIGAGELWDLGVAGDVAVVIEAGRGWVVDLGTRKASPLSNTAQADGADFDRDGVLLSTEAGPMLYPRDGSPVLDVKRAIAASAFRVADGYERAHLFQQDPARRGPQIVYVGQTGLFALDTTQGTVRALLLDAPEHQTVYRRPVVTADGTVFVQGLTSRSGAVGADGPVYRLRTRL